MKKYPILLYLVLLFFRVSGQIMPFGSADTADLKMTSCDFEKDANAEVLFDKGVMRLSGGLNMDRHIRIKIFNEFGKRAANVRLVFNSALGVGVSGIQAETFNFENGKIEITPVDKKDISIEKLDKNFSALVFGFPNVRIGSVIEYKFTSGWTPVWYFQGGVPIRYSEIKTEGLARAGLGYITYVNQSFVKNTGDNTEQAQVKSLANVHSLSPEPYMAAYKDNLQRIEFFRTVRMDTSWDITGKSMLKTRYFANQFTGVVSGEGGIIKKARALKSDEKKIAFLFDTVKNFMKWNGVSTIYAIDGTADAWDKRTGNTAEINLIVYYFLKRTGIKALPILISTRNNGKVDKKIPNPDIFNSLLVYVPVDSSKYFVLDATDRLNQFNTIPFQDVNGYGLTLDPDNLECKLVPVRDDDPVLKTVFLNCEISSAGKFSGSVQITDEHYNKIEIARKYTTLGQAKFIDSLYKKDNSINISHFEIENLQVDSLPVSQKFEFDADLAGSDQNYIYLNTNLFGLIEKNPFVSINRFSDIDFGYRNNFSISELFKMPAGYTTVNLSKTVTIVMPDNTIVFKRTVAEDDGSILIRLMVDHRQTNYFPKQYQDIHDFYKKMYELLNEQIVLKKL